MLFSLLVEAVVVVVDCIADALVVDVDHVQARNVVV